MSDIPYTLTIRFDGNDAERHEIDLYALGESLKGFARIAATAGNFAVNQKYSRYFVSHEVKVVAREARPNCFSIDIFWTFIQQQQILSGAFGAVIGALLPYIFYKAAERKAEMKMLKDSLDKAIVELGGKNDETVSRLLDLVEKMATDLKPSVRQAVAPIGNTCRTITIHSPIRDDTFNEEDRVIIDRAPDDEFTETRDFNVLITELDLEKQSCKMRVDGAGPDDRIPGKITDPQISVANNPYTAALAAQSQVTVKAKASLKAGSIVQLYISDIA